MYAQLALAAHADGLEITEQIMEQAAPSQLQLVDAVQSVREEMSEQVGWQKPEDHMHRVSALQESGFEYWYLHCIKQLLPVHEHMDVQSAAMEICEQVVVQTPVLTSYMQLLLATHSDFDVNELQPPVHAPLLHMHCELELQLPASAYWPQPLSQLPEALFHAQAGSRLHPPGLLMKAYGQVKEHVPKDHWQAETAWQLP